MDCMALWIIAIILAVVFAPILLGTAATLLMVAIPIVLLVFGLVIFVSLFQQAAAAVTNPAKCRSYGAAAMAVYVLLLLPPVSNWFFKTNNNWLYQPLLLAGPYALCLMMLSKNRGRGGKKGTGGFVLWILGSLCICAAGLGAQSSWVWGSILYVFILMVADGISLAGLALLMTVPAHGETTPKEKSAVGLIAAGLMIRCGWDLLGNLFNVLLLTAGGLDRAKIWGLTRPASWSLDRPVFWDIASTVVSCGTLLLFLVGTVQFVRCHFLKGNPAAAEKPKK
ncbi:hypothetical protein [uncultured Oscillibacter sp.]|uniref:hypothetical protein n=3 Tax=uncultured Oscillibacter sp. TaxID=876091 RepID=UPI0026086D87|nr:hypothetical protein [uncultured Oscillibacter sp.]